MTVARDGRDTMFFFLRHLGRLIFATRSETKQVSFGPPPNHGILKGRTFCDFFKSPIFDITND